MKEKEFTSAEAKEALLKDKDKFCGGCCWFCHEDTDGFGICYQSNKPLGDFFGCSHICHIQKFVSREQMRHHMAVLLQANRYRRDDNVPAIYKMSDPKELGEAIDFAYEYMKVFSNL